ncbi:hypothetical protein OPKNFCMD_5461 [Methylobacterium crusticola]|uniref:DUF3606 domain-containing protein n=1 Tax=Methylobacterium crusticola TaxID=1697972 RepID=A0ABQ4R4S7_9HYPH|nr:hypothetical protein OPKNFCMD_5461 [Methylobacterium crusticola]
MLNIVGARSGCGDRTQAPGNAVLGSTSTPDVSHPPRVVHRLAQRFALSPEVAAVVAQLAGLGPTEARR